MNSQKSELKSIILESLGRKIEEMSAQADIQTHRHEGGKEAFGLAAKKVAGLMEHVDKDLEAGKIAEIAGETLEIAAYAKRYIKKIIGLIDNMETAAEIAIHNARGRKKGIDDTVGFILKSWEEEKKKLENYKMALANGLIEDGPSGHPGLSLKAQRLRDEAESLTEKSEPESDTMTSAMNEAEVSPAQATEDDVAPTEMEINNYEFDGEESPWNVVMDINMESSPIEDKKTKSAKKKKPSTKKTPARIPSLGEQ